MKFQKFQWRLFIPTLVIFIIGLIILNKTVADQVSQTIQQTLESEIRSSLPLISKLIEQINFNNTDQDSLISIINQFGNWEEVEILILSSSGEITASSSNTSGSIQTFRSEIQEAISTGIGVSVDENLDEQLHIFHAASQINIDDSNEIHEEYDWPVYLGDWRNFINLNQRAPIISRS